MQKILFLASICLSFFGISPVHADGSPNTDNINSNEFIINISNMDPMKGSHSGGANAVGIDSLMAMIANITDILLFIIPILAGISMLIAGYFYIFSAGDSEKAGRAKTIIKWNIVAIFVAFLSLAIVKIVASFFN